MADIFISYKKEDKARVEVLARALEVEGFSVWIDTELTSGADWFSEILSQVDQARAVIGFWTSNAILPNGTFATSGDMRMSYVRQEHERALKADKLIPIIVDQGVMSAEFSSIQAEDFTAWQGGENAPEFRRLVARIGALAAPRWVKRRLAEADAALAAERAKRDTIEAQLGAQQRLAMEEVQRAALAEAERSAPLKAELREARAEIAQLEKELDEIANGKGKRRNGKREMARRPLFWPAIGLVIGLAGYCLGQIGVVQQASNIGYGDALLALSAAVGVPSLIYVFYGTSDVRPGEYYNVHDWIARMPMRLGYFLSLLIVAPLQAAMSSGSTPGVSWEEFEVIPWMVGSIGAGAFSIGLLTVVLSLSFALFTWIASLFAR